MNLHDTVATLAYLNSAWPHIEFGEETAMVWAEQLKAIDPVDAEQAMRDVVRHDERFPSIARFIAACRAAEHARAARQGAFRALPKGEPAPWPTELTEKLKEALGEQQGRHDHRGPQPCPVCGGRRPQPNERTNS